jgi:hypothetical protein
MHYAIRVHLSDYELRNTAKKVNSTASVSKTVKAKFILRAATEALHPFYNTMQISVGEGTFRKIYSCCILHRLVLLEGIMVERTD